MNKSIATYITNLGAITSSALMPRKNEYYIYSLLLCTTNNSKFLSFKK